MWRTRMQKTTALSTAEAEYHVAPDIAVKIVYLSNFLLNLGFPKGDDRPVFEDNTSSPFQSTSPIKQRSN